MVPCLYWHSGCVRHYFLHNDVLRACRCHWVHLCLKADNGNPDIMKFGLQHPNYSFDYRNHDSSHILDSLKNLVTRAETLGFDSFWVMDHFHQIPIVGKQDEPYLF
jgi:hypothetical protein